MCGVFVKRSEKISSVRDSSVTSLTKRSRGTFCPRRDFSCCLPVLFEASKIFGSNKRNPPSKGSVSAPKAMLGGAEFSEKNQQKPSLLQFPPGASGQHQHLAASPRCIPTLSRFSQLYQITGMSPSSAGSWSTQGAAMPPQHPTSSQCLGDASAVTDPLGVAAAQCESVPCQGFLHSRCRGAGGRRSGGDWEVFGSNRFGAHGLSRGAHPCTVEWGGEWRV